MRPEPGQSQGPTKTLQSYIKQVAKDVGTNPTLVAAFSTELGLDVGSMKVMESMKIRGEMEMTGMGVIGYGRDGEHEEIGIWKWILLKFIMIGFMLKMVKVMKYLLSSLKK